MSATLVEIQGYVYDAWLRMAQIYDAIGKSARAGALRRKAKALFKRFNDAFWDDDFWLLRLRSRR